MKAASSVAATDIKSYMHGVGSRARDAARILARTETAPKNAALQAMAAAVEKNMAALLAANKKDLDAGRAQGLDAAMLDRLELNEARVKSMAEGLRQIATLPDPVGEITDLNYRPSGIQVGRMRVPLGVIGIIYESRPNVTADAAGLCLKSGNASILRGGSEAIHSNQAIAACIHEGLKSAGLPADAVQVVETTDRAAVGELITMKEYVDVIVPRGGKGLIERISAEATIPVIKHLHGVCHVYIDDKADLDKARESRVQRQDASATAPATPWKRCWCTARWRTSSCRCSARCTRSRVELRGCEVTRKILSGIKAATEEDWYTEYLAPILSIRVVDDLDEAMDHIAKYGSQHTDAIVTEDITRARRFLREVDSSSVMVNASTRFADGFEYGLGAEIGISTDKIHARGPVGLEGLTSQKFVVLGDGHVRK